MNAIAAHRDELERLFVNLSRDTAVSGVGFVALLDAYITPLDTKLLRHQRKHRYGAGAKKRRINMEPTLTQNCALYYAQHTTPKRRAALFKRFRTAARKQAPITQRPMKRDDSSQSLLNRRRSHRAMSGPLDSRGTAQGNDRRAD
jgi:hypothetical protein